MKENACDLLLLISTLLLCIVPHAHPSNPDSEIVQDSSHVDSKEDAIVSAAMRVSETQGRSVDSDRIPGVRIIKPFSTSAGIVYREIGVSEIGDKSLILSILRDLRSNGPDSSGQGGGGSSYSNGQTRIIINEPQRPSGGNNRRGPDTSEPDRSVYVPPIGDGNSPFSARSFVVRNNYPPPEVPRSPNGPQTSPGGNRRFFIERVSTRGTSQNDRRTILRSNTGERDETRYMPRVPANNDGSRISGGQVVRPIAEAPESAQNPSGYGQPMPNRQITNGFAKPLPPDVPNPSGFGSRLPGGQNPSNFPQPLPDGQNRGTSEKRDFNRESTGYTNRPRNPPGTRGVGASSSANNPNNRRRGVSPDSNLFAGIVNDFAFKLVSAMNLGTSNFVLSPLSIFVALAMCYLGSEGQTEAQLAQALGLNVNNVHRETLHRGIRDLMSLIRGSPDYQLYVASGMFMGRNFTAEMQYQDDLHWYYAAELRNLDYGNGDIAMSIINDWVSRNTRNTITSLVDTPPGPLTRMLLLNAIYFKGVWKTQFPADLTQNGRFQAADGRTKEVPVMVLYREKFPVYRSDELRHSFVKLPYAGNEMSMVIALPYTESEEPMPSMKNHTLCYVLDAMQETQLDILSIPKFKLEDVKSLKMSLMQLGISDIFDARAVNLRRLRRQNDVFVSAILHKAVVDVNEEGTTAAGVSGVKLVGLTYLNDFVVDRPFAFYIVHEPSGLVLFYGKVHDFPGAPEENIRETVRPRPNAENAPVNATVLKRSPSKVRLHGAVKYDDAE